MQEVSSLLLYVQQNPDYTNTFVFTNDFSALLPDAPEPGILVVCLEMDTVEVIAYIILGNTGHPLLKSAQARGIW